MAVRNASSAGSAISRVALQKDFAAQAMEERELRTMPESMRESQRLVDASQRLFRAKGLCLELREKRVEERRVEHLALIREGRQRLPKFCGGGRGIMETAPRPSRKQFGPAAKKRQSHALG